MKNLLLFALVFVLATSCIITGEEPNNEANLEELSFPQSFDFVTSKEIAVLTSGLPGTVRAYINNEEVTYLGSFANVGTEVSFTVPSFENELLLVHYDGYETQSTILDIPSSNSVSWAFSENGGGSSGRMARAASVASSGCTDVLFAVENSVRGFWAIDVSNDAYAEEVLPLLEGGGSIACALDQEDSMVYYNVGKNLWRFDLRDSTFSIKFTSNPFNGNYPRFCYNGGNFYMSNGTNLYEVDASTNEILNHYRISGFVNSSSGGDLAFASDGTLYLSCFSGLYKFTGFEGSTASITRVSAENFPYQLTSMAIDREDRIFVGTNEGNSKLIEMSKEDGSHRIVRTYDHKINDLTAWRCDVADLGDLDSDEDGVIDALDDHPYEAEAAYDVYTPSEIGYGTLAFEDMWPENGDYDFNDMVVNYKFINVLNAHNKSVKLEIDLKVAAAGASFRNGFGIELPVEASKVASVLGTRESDGLVALDANGLESGHTNAVVIPFDNAFSVFGGGSLINTGATSHVNAAEVYITIEFTEPIDGSVFSGAPFNPFIFSNADRSREIHLKNGLPTALADHTVFGSYEDATDLESGISYVNSQNVPWAIDIIHTFRYPREKNRIDRAYNHFVNWGQSNGASYPDWYKDNSGYREENRIYYAD